MSRKLLLIIVALLAVVVVAYWLATAERPAKINFDFPRSLTVGEEIRVPLKISVSEPVNAAEFYFQFPPELLEIKTVDKTGSFYQLWIVDYPRFSNEEGTIELAGGLPKPGFVGQDGLIATVVFRVKSAGSGTITLDQEKSRILANDGLGTAIDSTFTPPNFSANQ